MALDTKNINTILVGNCILNPSRNYGILVEEAGLNPFSYYAPGALSVDTNKNIVITPPDNAFKIGDYRGYNKDAVKPSILTPSGNLNWGPGGTTCSFVMNYRLEALNLYAFASRGDYVTMDFYASEANRASGTNLKHSQTILIPVTSDTPLSKHTRQSQYRPSTSGWIQGGISDFETGWLGSVTTVYVDTYISDMSANRKINFGTVVSDGYSTITLAKLGDNTAPYIYAQNTNNPYPPSGYTAIFPAIAQNTGPVCGYGASFNETIGGTTYAFNIVAKAVYGTGLRVVGIDSVDIILTINGVRTVVATGVELYSYAGRYFSGTLANGGSWAYGSAGAITFENGSIQSNPPFTQC